MKKKIVLSAMLVLAVICTFTNPFAEINENSDLPPEDKKFLITAMHAGDVDTNYIYFPDLGANAWHKYTGPEWGWPGISNDQYNQPTSAYRDAVIQRIDDNQNYGFRTVMDRPKIEYLTFGQRSEYQCEDVTNVDPDFWFYTYNINNTGKDTMDNSQFGNNQWVKFCDANPDNPGSNQGYVVKDLKANREQANRYWPAWIADSTFDWYVMPKIRIDPSVIDINPETKICAIIIKDWNGITVDSIEILAKHFRKIQNVYSGDYLEEYYFLQTPNELAKAILIDSSKLCPGERRDFSDWAGVPVSTDFRVYWYGQCDMWIDYVKVENQPAHELFKGQWDQHIKEETDLALENYNSSNPIPNNFYIEEFEFNIVSAMKYVNDIITSHSQQKLSLMVNLNYPLFSLHIPLDNNLHRDILNAAYINKHLINKANLKILVNLSYPLEGFVGSLYPVNDKPTSAHPSTLSQNDYGVNISPLPVFLKSLHEDQLNITADLKQTF